MADEYISPLGSLVNWIEGERQRNRQQEDADLDQKITLIHDMITGPGANPARTADGIRSILELQQAKGGRQKGKRKGGMAGFMGANEEMMPDFLAQLIHKDRPYQGPTYEEKQTPVMQPASVSRLPGQMDQQPSFGSAIGINQQPDEQISSAAISQQMGRGAPTGGQSVLRDPVMIPPPPLNAAPTGTPMLSAARQMQQQPQNVQLPGAMGMQTTRTQLPDEQQPFMRSPQEIAELEGQAAGIKENAIYDARNQAKIAMYKRAGLSDEEIRQLLVREATGAGAQLQIQDAGFFKIGDRVIHAIRQLNPRTGMWDTVDQVSGLPVPPEAEVIAAPSTMNDTAPTSYKEWQRSKTDAESRGETDFPSYEEWLTIDARRRPSVNVTVPRNEAGLTNSQALAAAASAQTRYERTRQELNDIERNVGVMNTTLPILEAEVKQTGGKLGPSHIALIYAFNHAVEPDSVVREGEFDRATKGQAWFDRLRGLATKMSKGGVGMTIEEVREYVTLANAIMKAAQIRHRQQELSAFAAQAKAGGYGLDQVFRKDDLDYWNGPNAGGAGTPQPTGPQVGDTRQAQNGLTLYFDGQGWTDTPVLPNPPGGKR